MQGQPVKDISEQSGMHRSYVYEQKNKVETFLANLDKNMPETPIITITPKVKDRLIISMALDCGSSIEGIQRALWSSLRIKTSIGHISGVLKEAARRADELDSKINLGGIHQGANDEIFQCNKPVLTGIDPETSYIYLMEEATDRTAETWQIYMEDCIERGLALETTINDGGSGLNAGIPKAFPKITVQADTFHALHGLGKEINKAERKAEALIKAEADLETRVKGLRPQQKTKDKLESIRPKVKEQIDVYDTVSILFGWLKTLLGFSGYNMPDTIDLIMFLLNEMNNVSTQLPNLKKGNSKNSKKPASIANLYK